MFVDIKSLGTDHVIWCWPMGGLEINCVERGQTYNYITTDIVTYRAYRSMGRFVKNVSLVKIVSLIFISK